MHPSTITKSKTCKCIIFNCSNTIFKISIGQTCAQYIKVLKSRTDLEFLKLGLIFIAYRTRHILVGNVEITSSFEAIPPI